MAKKISILFKTILLLFFAIITYILVQIPFDLIYSIPENINLSDTAVVELNNDGIFGRFIKSSLDQIITASEPNAIVQSELKLKLFNKFVIKSVKVNLDSVKMYACGNPVGFSLRSGGVIVVNSASVLTKNGSVNTLQNSSIKSGDVIISLSNNKIESVTDITKTINNVLEKKDEELEIKCLRNNKEFTTKIKPALDVQSNTYKLGLYVKENASGVGTLTFINETTGRYGSLGHAICDTDTKLPIEVKEGEMYKCMILGINKGTKGKAGELKGIFVQGKNNIGTVDKNCKYGIYGQINNQSNILQNKELLEAGGRLTSRPGKAKIRVCLDGEHSKDYDIEIVKTNYQNTSNEKSMVIRVTDKELLEKTGGIVQGMSGSPIIQNGRIIGAVTHVFINDPTKGFGVYLDWMLKE